MKKKWIKIRLETKVRELNSKFLIAYKLLEKGYGIIISENVEIYPKGLSFLNSAYIEVEQILKKLKNQGDKIVVLHEEGLVLDEKYYELMNPKKNLKLLDYFFCYGHYQERLTKNYYLEDDSRKIVITGNPRNNILNSNFKILEEDNVKKIRERYGKFILYVSNGPNTPKEVKEFSKEERYLARLKTFKELGLVNSLEEEEEFKKRFEYYEKILTEVLELLKKIEGTLIKVIVRPHPSESKEFWEKIFKNSKNVKIIYEGILSEWIKASELVIQNGCTSSIESLIIGRKCISFKPIYDQKWDIELVDKTSLNINSQEQLLKLLLDNWDTNYEKINYDQKSYKEFLERYISYYNGDESVEEIVKYIESLDIEKKYFNYYVFYFYKLRKTLKIKLALLLYPILKILNIKKIINKIINYKNGEIYSLDKFGKINETDFLNLLKKYNEIYEQNLEINIKKIRGNTFLLTNKKENKL